MPKRSAMWDELSGPVDVLVVGGGVTGAGIARDAARRGLKVALVEMNDLAFGTSSRSSKLIHGGLRYLEHYEFSLVFEAVSERRILQDIAPHLVNPLGFLFPVYRGARRQLWLINAGMWLYDGLSLFRSPKHPHRTSSRGRSREIEPAVKQEGLKGAPLYYDCATDDARLTLETALDAAAGGAIVATWAKVTRFLKTESGRVRGVVVEDVLGGGEKEIEARTVVNATGPVDRPHDRDEQRPAPPGTSSGRPRASTSWSTARSSRWPTRWSASTRPTSACSSRSPGATAPTSARPTPTTRAIPRRCAPRWRTSTT